MTNEQWRQADASCLQKGLVVRPSSCSGRSFFVLGRSFVCPRHHFPLSATSRSSAVARPSSLIARLSLLVERCLSCVIRRLSFVDRGWSRVISRSSLSLVMQANHLPYCDVSIAIQNDYSLAGYTRSASQQIIRQAIKDYDSTDPHLVDEYSFSVSTLSLTGNAANEQHYCRSANHAQRVATRRTRQVTDHERGAALGIYGRRMTNNHREPTSDKCLVASGDRLETMGGKDMACDERAC